MYGTPSRLDIGHGAFNTSITEMGSTVREFDAVINALTAHKYRLNG